jgi:glycosyltransferase involved in cell wall biosynthesis
MPVDSIAGDDFQPGLVSVVVPCYRQAQFLGACIESLQRQTWTAWEAIVVDDGSPDETAQVLADLAEEEPRVRPLTQPNLGRSAARNAALAAAQGEFVQFLDADDLLEPRKFERHVQHLRACAGAAAVFGSAWYFSSADPTRRSRSIAMQSNDDWIARLARQPGPLLGKLAEQNQFPICSPLLRRVALSTVGHFDKSLRTAEDWDLWLRCAAAGLRFDFVDGGDSDALIRVHGESVTHDRPEMWEGTFEMRLRSLRYLHEARDRRFALAGAVIAIDHMPMEERNKCYGRLKAAAAPGDERLALWLASHWRTGAANGGTFAARCMRVLPWRWRFLVDAR